MWSCAHPNTSGFHYHLALKLTTVMRWNQDKTKLMEDHDVVVNFSGEHNMYPYAQRYAVKEDPDAVSPNHPLLAALGSPKTKKAVAKRRLNAKAAREAQAAQPTTDNTPSSSRPTTRSQSRRSQESNPEAAAQKQPKVPTVGRFEASTKMTWRVS
eukprot:TCONS_00037104-protein